jgi:hypothetical protein
MNLIINEKKRLAPPPLPTNVPSSGCPAPHPAPQPLPCPTTQPGRLSAQPPRQGPRRVAAKPTRQGPRRVAPKPSSPGSPLLVTALSEPRGGMEEAHVAGVVGKKPPARERKAPPASDANVPDLPQKEKRCLPKPPLSTQGPPKKAKAKQAAPAPLEPAAVPAGKRRVLGESLAPPPGAAALSKVPKVSLLASAGASARLLESGESGAGAAPVNADLEEDGEGGEAPLPPLGAGNVLTPALILQNVSDAVGGGPNRDAVRAKFSGIL